MTYDEDDLILHYAKDTVSFMALQENVDDKDFVSYVSELAENFPTLKVNILYFNTIQLQEAQKIFEDINNKEFVFIKSIEDVVNNSEIYIHNRMSKFLWLPSWKLRHHPIMSKHLFIVELTKEFKESKNVSDIDFTCPDTIGLENSIVIKVFEKHKNMNQLRFIESLTQPFDEEKIKNSYCQGVIGFLAVEENLEDQEFMNYIQELIVRFPKAKVKAFYFNEEEHKLLKSKCDFFVVNINILQLNSINFLCSEIEMYVHKHKSTFKDLVPFLRQKTFIYAYYFFQEYKTKTLKDADQEFLKREIDYVKFPQNYGLPVKGFQEVGCSNYQYVFHHFMAKSGRPGFVLDLSINQYEFVHFTTLEYIFNSDRFKSEYLKFLKKVSLNG